MFRRRVPGLHLERAAVVPGRPPRLQEVGAARGLPRHGDSCRGRGCGGRGEAAAGALHHAAAPHGGPRQAAAPLPAPPRLLQLQAEVSLRRLPPEAGGREPRGLARVCSLLVGHQVSERRSRWLKIWTPSRFWIFIYCCHHNALLISCCSFTKYKIKLDISTTDPAGRVSWNIDWTSLTLRVFQRTIYQNETFNRIDICLYGAEDDNICESLINSCQSVKLILIQ